LHQPNEGSVDACNTDPPAWVVPVAALVGAEAALEVAAEASVAVETEDVAAMPRSLSTLETDIPSTAAICDALSPNVVNC